jgi:hypothetical protein
MNPKSTSKTQLLAPVLLCALCIPSHAATVFSALFNTLTTLTSSAAISGYGWYADTGTTTGNNQRVRIDSFQINAIPEPGSALLGGLGLLAVLRRRRPASQP